MSTLKKLTAAIALGTLGLSGVALAQTTDQGTMSERQPQTQSQHPTQTGAEGHSLTGHGATGQMGAEGAGATGSAANMQHGATGRQAEGGHAIEEAAGADQDATGPGAGAVGRQDAPGTTGAGPRGEQGTTGTPGGAGTGAATGAGAGAATGTGTDANTAPGHSSMQQGGMNNPARTADRPGVTGAPDEIERNQRDLPASGSNTN